MELRATRFRLLANPPAMAYVIQGACSEQRTVGAGFAQGFDCTGPHQGRRGTACDESCESGSVFWSLVVFMEILDSATPAVDDRHVPSTALAVESLAVAPDLAPNLLFEEQFALVLERGVHTAAMNQTGHRWEIHMPRIVVDLRAGAPKPWFRSAVAAFLFSLIWHTQQAMGGWAGKAGAMRRHIQSGRRAEQHGQGGEGGSERVHSWMPWSGRRLLDFPAAPQCHQGSLAWVRNLPLQF